MNAIRTKPDERIVMCLRRIIYMASPRDASIRYEGAAIHPLTNSRLYVTGMVAGSSQTIEDLYEFLGETGLITIIEWHPTAGSKYVQIRLHHEGQALSITNCFNRPDCHIVSLRGAHKMPADGTPESGSDLNKVRYHVVDTQDQLVELALDLIRYF